LNVPQEELEVHWLSIANSASLVILLTGFIALVLNRTVKRDISRYSQSNEESEEDEYGWKLIHGDVFRFPSHKNLLSALLGVGAQLFVVAFLLLVLSVAGLVYPEQVGSLYTPGLIIFALASGVAGLISAYFYKQLQGEKWARNILLAAFLFVGPVTVITAAADLIARFYHATSALPISTGIEIGLIWVVIGLPLTILGGITGRRIAGEFSAPVRTKGAVREIPSVPFYRSGMAQVFVGGFLPFSAIYIELFYIYETMWGYNSYALYGVLFLVFMILITVTASVAITLTYFQLASEDHQWWWRSFLTGGCTGFYVLVYSGYYYVFISPMSGFLQIVKYCSFTLACSYIFFVMLGAVGFYSSLLFVRRIYSSLKVD